MKPSLILALSIGLAAPASAQDTPRDWDMIRDADKKVTVAYSEFDNGVMVAVRCADGGYEALIAGLPPAASEQRRPLGISFDDADMVTRDWQVGREDTVAVSDLPARFARQLREGGRLKIQVPNGAADGRNLRYDLTLPASPASIDETLAACNRPVNDPRDVELDALPEEGLPADISWAERPRPSYPSSPKYARGFATVTCVSNPDGSLRDCGVEAEYPRDGGFGEAALRGARRGRLQNADNPASPVPTRLIVYRTNFIMSGYETREDRQGRRAQRAQNREERR